MENEKSITGVLEKRDWKLKFQALFLWWKLCFLFIFTIAFLISIIFEELDIFLRLLKCAIIAFVLALPADALVYFVILPFLCRERKKFVKLNEKINQEGINSENLIELESVMDFCKENKFYSGYASDFGIILAAYYIVIGEYQKAENNLNFFDISLYNDVQNTISGKIMLSNYYSLRIQLENQKNGRDAANAAYALAEPYFSKFYGENELINCLIDSGTAEYDYANGRYNDAIQRILPYVEFKEVKCETYASLARYSAAAGNREQAMEYLQLAEKYKQNATDKAQIEYIRNTLFK